MKSSIGALILVLSTATATWTYFDFVDFWRSKVRQHKIQPQKIDPRVIADFKEMEKDQIFSLNDYKIFQIDVDTDESSEEMNRLARSYHTLVPTVASGNTIMKISLINSPPKVIVLMALEEKGTKNRIWEIGRTFEMPKSKSNNY